MRCASTAFRESPTPRAPASTATVAAQEVDEEFGPLIPVSTYGASKLGCEAMLAAYAHMFGIHAVVFRFANVVGARQTHGVTYDFVRRLLEDPTELRDPRRREPEQVLHPRQRRGLGDAHPAGPGLGGLRDLQRRHRRLHDGERDRRPRGRADGAGRRPLRVHGRSARLEGRRAGRALPQRQARRTAAGAALTARPRRCSTRSTPTSQRPRGRCIGERVDARTACGADRAGVGRGLDRRPLPERGAHGRRVRRTGAPRDSRRQVSAARC